eukprot:CAMPEP_0196780814 /NCGR_PEP_ID=MMETSP1104-20130614/8561_1 /TAXON_ID=33652 /ORGANISM="Cafeteria sp., Strain Caron Lab Isolate" /LENGTH=159 /DNA_ID=CAMNT_0042151029 /DNA_START=35 /DNA_END=514 /DNA_ORIENTATION=+
MASSDVNLHIQFTAVIDAPIESACKVLASFDPAPVNGMGVFDEPVELVEGDPSAIGAIRKVPVAPGKFLVERLVALDTVKHSQTYELIPERSSDDALPVPIKSLRGSLSLEPITFSNQSFFRWTLDAAVPADSAGAATEAIRGMQAAIGGKLVDAFKKA